MLSKRFAEKCTKNPRTKDMFEKQTQKNTMLIICKEKYKVINARTVRMENSAIPKIIKHLNKKHKEYTKKL